MTASRKIRARGIPPVQLGAPPEYPNPGSDIPPELNEGRAGFVVADCSHPVAKPDWLAGFRLCDGCDS